MKEQNIFTLIHAMDQVTNNLLIKWNKMFNENLGVSHILILSYLNSYGKCRPSDLARLLGLTPPTLTHLSGKLVKKELAVRVADEEDRRIVYLQITDAGVGMLNKAQEDGRQLRRELFENLTEEEREALLSVYEKLNKVMSED
ncbi:MarR family winged helix-turn-helix transcriptional regulator [Paenibacillus polymyxa]|uniref:MarR family winged helix-turn-helix transcriptional regulator n=1 Tax=Paenibacillus TaxID=44249 RepID=UPI00042E8553|nr:MULTISPECIES: MarR family transcriptional regulator [Paenibacillus]MEB4783878.1 MarR family transcriptional regulator [Paenibacillus jamilae]AHM64300.1 regulatory protein MarR [Paenibacillus polymyxa SQR-21]AIY09973.1 MarR family transcriptional regulator [Paenibacillus polymyxa]KAF6582887.1 MarR family transcriptional regulator [Paenibacillus sp. EKM211P]KAF6653932.1 MarR family transcriptional regulator [Paenibacillus sp. EKM301P]